MTDSITVKQIAYIAGMPRAGTTFLYHNLQKHPQIYVPFRRKSNYFSLHTEKQLGWLLDHFKYIKSDQIGIDTETLFFVDKSLESYKKIHQLNPNAKVMLFVRSPGDWVWSLYKQIATFDNNIVSFEDFLAGKYILIEDGKEVPFSIVNGDIENNIKALIDTFKGNLLIIDFTLFKQNPLRLLKEIEKFLGIPSFFNENNFDNKRINANDRGHFVFIALLVRQEWFINLLNKLPRGLVIFTRRLYDILGTLTAIKTEERIHKVDAETRMAQNNYSQDEKYIKQLFIDEKVLRY